MSPAIRYASVAVAIFALLTSAAGKAHAIYIEADLPVSLSFSNSDTAKDYDSVSGALLTVGDLFLGFGVGYEMYTARWKATGGGSAPEARLDYLDILWAAPVPVVNLSVGAGVGNETPQGDLSKAYSSSMMSQIFFRVGIPIAKVFDVHIGYHQFSGKMPGKTVGSGTFPDVKMGGSLTTIGARFGF